jgi:hypothetical protein
MTEAHKNAMNNHIVSVLQRLINFEMTRLARAGLDWCAGKSFHHLMTKFTSTTSADVEYWTLECPSLEQNKGTHFTAVELLSCLNTVCTHFKEFQFNVFKCVNIYTAHTTACIAAIPQLLKVATDYRLQCRGWGGGEFPI